MVLNLFLSDLRNFCGLCKSADRSNATRENGEERNSGRPPAAATLNQFVSLALQAACRIEPYQ